MMWKNDWQTVLNAAVHHGATNPWRRVQSTGAIPDEYEQWKTWGLCVHDGQGICQLCSIAFCFFFGILHLVSLFFLYHFLGCTCNTIVACRACEKGSRTRKAHGRADRRGRLTVPPLHVLHVCVCKCRTMTECQFIRCHNLWHQLLRRIAITNDSQRWVNCLSHIIILFCWFNMHNLIAYNWFHKSVFRVCN